jgi:hypothetical protein
MLQIFTGFAPGCECGKRIAPVCFLICLLLGPMFCSPGLSSARAETAVKAISDSLAIEPKVMDFGRVNNSKAVLDLQFTITNQGKTAVEITGARSSCGCTVPQLSKSRLQPGGHLVVPVKLHVANRMGKFETRVMVDVLGASESLIVPLKGTLIQDLWYDGQLIQCIVNDPAKPVDKDFDIYTIDWPAVQFDWNRPDDGMSLAELSRTTTDGVTAIRCRLHVEAGAAEHRVAHYAILTPRDSQIKGLTLPVVCYVPQVRDVAVTAQPENGYGIGPQASKPEQPTGPVQVSLGVIARGGVRHILLPRIASAKTPLKVSDVKNLPDGTQVDLRPAGDKKEGSLEVSLRVAQSAPLGPVVGSIYLTSADGQKYTVEVLGYVGPKQSDKNNP